MSRSTVRLANNDNNPDLNSTDLRSRHEDRVWN